MSLLVWACWLGLFCVLEGLAAFWPGCPWGTFSRTIWDLQVRYGAAATLAVLFVLSTLVAHLPVFRNLAEGDKKKEPHEEQRSTRIRWPRG